ncbi:MAG: T9SS type A sorting domain-containing protein, partial [Ignavibacteriales bacterium]|nr:T9SS type A sorting domain-containing protein [Ignavibacteriales bacterium]
DPNNAGEDTLVVSAPDDSSAGVVHGFSSFGQGRQMSITRIETKSDDGEISGMYHLNSLSSGVSNGRENVLLWYEKKGSFGSFVLNATQHEIGFTHVRLSGVPDGGPVQIDDWTYLIGVATSSFDLDASFSSSDGNFSIEYLRSQISSGEGTSTTLTIRVKAEFKCSNPPTGVENQSSHTLPRRIILYQNYPNPFNPTTTISFVIPQKSFITLKVYDILGQEVMALLNERKDEGRYDVRFDGSRLTTAPYFYRLQVGNNIETKKLILLK